MTSKQLAGVAAALMFGLTTVTACGHASVGGWADPNPTTAPSEPPGWTATTITNMGSPVTISHPAAWRFVKSGAVYLGGSAVVGYFTNAPTVTQCHTTKVKGGEQIDCGGPVVRLAAEQVLITVSAEYLYAPDGAGRTNAVVDGRLATISTISDLRYACPRGGGLAQALAVDLSRAAPADPRSHWRLFITACEGISGDMPSHGDPLDNVERMLRAITFPLATR